MLTDKLTITGINIKQTRIPTTVLTTPAAEESMLARTVSITPTSPDVPIPPPDAVDLSLNITVENGPAIMLEITAGYNPVFRKVH